jgi:hypothetical protein
VQVGEGKGFYAYEWSYLHRNKVPQEVINLVPHYFFFLICNLDLSPWIYAIRFKISIEFEWEGNSAVVGIARGFPNLN